MAKKNLLFLLVDCLRADAAFGEGRGAKTPALDGLKARGASFTQAVSVAGNTHVCLASLVTGVYPFIHGIRPLSINRFHLSTGKMDPRYPVLAEILKTQGYKTAASVAGPALHVTGFDRGFEKYTYRQDPADVYLGGRFGETLRGDLRELRKGTDPWFHFVHLWEVHAPRQVPREFNGPAFGRNRYERAVSGLDARLPAILAEVDLDTTVVVVHGDHGEGTESAFEFLLHPALHDRIGIHVSRFFYGMFFKWIHRFRFLQSAHGLNLYDYMVRVPLVIAGTDRVPRGTAVADLASQVDILPTLLDLLDVPQGGLPPVHGRSLLPALRGERLPPRPVYMEAYSGKSVSRQFWPGRRVKPGTFEKPPALVGIRTEEWKCIWVPDDPRIPVELYFLATDPEERTNLVEKRPEVAADLKAKLKELEASLKPEDRAPLSGDEQAEMEEKLRKLGYI